MDFRDRPLILTIATKVIREQLSSVSASDPDQKMGQCEGCCNDSATPDYSFSDAHGYIGYIYQFGPSVDSDFSFVHLSRP